MDQDLAPINQSDFDRIYKIMRDTFGDTFKYYKSDPGKIPKDSLPAMIFEEEGAKIQQDATTTDAIRTQISLTIILNKQDDFGASDDTDMTKQKLKNYVMEMDATTGRYKDRTVMKALRTHITLGQKDSDQVIDVNYKMQPRPGGLITSGIVVSIVTTQKVTRDEQIITV